MATILSSEATTRCLLVVAKPTGRPELRRLLDGARGRRLELRVLAPAFVRSRLQFLASDVDEGIRQARSRLERSLAEIEADGGGLRAQGEVGESDPLLAIDSALATFAADEIVIVPSDGHGHWAEKRLAEQAGERFPVPVRAL
ncbi:MAG TPA: hypothetical protein VGI73_12710 [Solirubrobacterales bacterium]|jgi:hypothetical protein